MSADLSRFRNGMFSVAVTRPDKYDGLVIAFHDDSRVVRKCDYTKQRWTGFNSGVIYILPNYNTS